MAELYNMVTGTSITPIVESLTPTREVNQITNYGLDGTFYMQILGIPKVTYEVICYTPRTNVALIENAWSAGHTMRVTMSHGTYYGKIIDLQKSSMPQEYFKFELKLARVEDPT